MDQSGSNKGNRQEFREVLREIVHCLRGQLQVPGVSPFGPEELVAWFREISVEDIKSVWEE